MEGVGAKTLRALALASEMIYGTPASTRDPARFSFAVGGKDGFPYPVDLETYDKTVEVLRAAVNKANIDRSERVKALKRLVEYGKERIAARRKAEHRTKQTRTALPKTLPPSSSRCASAARSSGNSACTDRAGLAPREQRPHVRFEVTRDRAFLRDRARAQRRPGDASGASEARAAGRATARDPPIRPICTSRPFSRQALDVARQIVAADDVEDDVHAAPRRRVANDRDEVLGLVVDRASRAKRRRSARARSARSGRGEDGRAERPCELDRGRADAARAAVHEHGLAAESMPRAERDWSRR